MSSITSARPIWKIWFVISCFTACNSPTAARTSDGLNATYVLYSIGGQPLPFPISDVGPVILSGTLTLRLDKTYTSRQSYRVMGGADGDVASQTVGGGYSVQDSTLILRGNETSQYTMAGSSLRGLTSLGRQVVYQLGAEQTK
jgi:hypothetical protein